MNNKEKFLGLVEEKDSKSSEKNNWRIANRVWLRESQDIAFKILEKLEELGWSQKRLAEALSVSPQYVNKMLKGRENFTLETLTKLQTLLEIPLLASFYEGDIHIEGETTVSPVFYTDDYSSSTDQSVLFSEVSGTLHSTFQLAG